MSFKALCFFHAFRESGRKVFTFTPDLLTLLSHTEFKAIGTQFFELPFNCIYLHDLSASGIRIDGSMEFDLQSAFVYKCISDDAAHYMNIMRARGVITDDIIYLLGIYFVPLEFDPQSSINNARPIYVPVSEGDLFKNFEATLNLWKKEMDYDTAQLNWYRDAISLIINCILYINSPSASSMIIRPEKTNKKGTTNPKKLRRAEKNKQTRLPYYALGRDIVISKHDRHYINTHQSDNERHTMAWMVRGHWRQQPVGTGRTERKLIWIQPYVKGTTDIADVINKQYKVT